MIVWKKTTSLLTGKTSYYPKYIDTPIIRIFNDFDWWKSFLTKNSYWIYKNRKELPEKIQKQLSNSFSMHMWEHDERYHGHRHW